MRDTYTIGAEPIPSWLGVRFETPTDCYIKYMRQEAKVGDKIIVEKSENGMLTIQLERTER